jgi:hypothetical protein
MASIPLPALSTQAPSQPDLLANFTRLMQLHNLQQEGQERALQMQQQQQALADQGAVTAAMQE